MSTKATGNKKHLTLADRAAIEHGISCGENFTQIAHRINKDSSTISKEIRRHLFRVPHFQNETQRKRSECEHYQNCEKQHICGNQTCNSLCWKCRPTRCSMYCPDFTLKFWQAQKSGWKTLFSEYSDKYLQKCPWKALILLGFWRGTVEMKRTQHSG